MSAQPYEPIAREVAGLIENARTPGPWVVTHFHDTVEIHDDADCGVIVARMPTWGIAAEVPDQREANAAFIVKACNAHDDLVAALQLARDAMLLADWNISTASERNLTTFMFVHTALKKAGAL